MTLNVTDISHMEAQVPKHSGRIVILSDTHLGKPDRGARSAQALRPLWQGADELIINGDIAEVHDVTCRVEAARQVMMIQQFCEEDGVELTLLSGNHDPYITDRRYLSLFDGEVFITHGDVLHPAISPWNPNSWQLRKINENALDTLDTDSRESFDGRASAAQFASHAKWDELATHPDDELSMLMKLTDKVHKLGRVMWYWHTLPRSAAVFAGIHAPESRFFIFGHIHRSGIWEIDGRTIINTGSYDFPSKPHGIVIEDGQLSMRAIHRDGLNYRFDDSPIRTFALGQQSAA